MRFILSLVVATLLAVESTTTTVQVGSTAIRILSTDRTPQGFVFLSLHEDEHTAVAAATQFIDRRGGGLTELKGQGRRLVSFQLGRIRYTFDPNRIFTDVGLEKSLRMYGPYSQPAHEAILPLRAALLTGLGGHLTAVVAVHNNSNGNLSAESYKPGRQFQSEASRIAINPTLDPDDFFLVLDPALFERLRAMDFNVILQSTTPTDDGSLSVYCQQAGIPYINVEAEEGHLSEQVRMLEALSSAGMSREK
jgi:hypothetical protein